MISVAICTYNRAGSLKRTLHSLTVDVKTVQGANNLPLQWELLVIDNNSTDETVAVIESFKNKLPLVYLQESKQGLSNARNCAIQHFKGDWLIFTDDDMTFCRGWLTAYADVISQLPADNSTGFLGGAMVPRFQHEKPVWLHFPPFAGIRGLVGYYDLGNETIVFDEHSPATLQTPFGANFALSRACIDKFGFFNARLGRIGNDRGRGEESDYFYHLLRNGIKGRYIPAALNYHWVQAEHLSFRAVYRQGLAKGKQALLTRGNSSPQISKPDLIIKAVNQAGKAFFQFMKGKKANALQCVMNIGLYIQLLKDKQAKN